GAQGGLADRYRRRQARPGGDLGHQSRRPQDGPMGARPGHPGSRRGRGLAGPAAGPDVRLRPRPPGRRRSRRSPQAVTGPSRAAQPGSGVTDPADRGCALVTGAAQGIGRVIAETLAAAGWVVAACDRNDRVVDTVETIVKGGGRAVPAVFDVADHADAARAHDDVVAALGPVQVVVANAGIVDNIARAERMSP